MKKYYMLTYAHSQLDDVEFYTERKEDLKQILHETGKTDKGKINYMIKLYMEAKIEGK